MRPVELSAFMEQLAQLSGQAILPFFRTQLSVIDKGRSGQDAGRFDPVTEADRAAETVIRRHIRAAFPNHGVLGEEFETENADAEYLWVVDPIDGTRAFICGLPVWGTLIGLMRNGDPVMGVMHQPYTGELFFGDGRHAQLKGPRGPRELRARHCDGLADAHLMTTDPRLFSDAEREGYERVERAVKLTRYGTDCYAYAMLASGLVDLVIESGLKAYDIVALIPIIEGAGGVVTTWEGGSAKNGGRIVAAASPTLHAEVLKLLAPA
jgi:myo-inositol-1(or 4)-monophosphatase